MRLTQLYIDGFGIFTAYTLSGLQAGLNIIAGGNETGKSTLLQFIRFTLFGYPRLLDQRQPPIGGGNHGGRIKALMSDGAEIVFERTAGYPGGIQLHTDTGPVVDPADWSRLLGHASGDLFENVYAFSLDELIGLDSLNRSGVEDKIFSIGLGLKNISINEIEQALVSRMEAVYKPRGSKQRAVTLLREIEEYERQVGDVQSHLPRYRQLSRDIERDRNALGKIEADLADRQARYDRLSCYGKCYESFVILKDADRELSALPKWRDYPPDGPARLERLETEEARLSRETADLAEDLHAAESNRPVDYNEALLNRPEQIEKLSFNLEKYKTWVQEYRQDRLALAELNRSIRQRITAINAQWKEENVLSFADLISHRNRLQAFIERLETLRKNQDRLEDRIGLLKARRSLLNMRNAFIILGLAMLAGATPLMIFKQYLWGTVLLIMGTILVAGRKLVTMDDPLKEALQAAAWLEAEKVVAGNECRRYIDEELGLPPDLSPENALESLQVIERLGPDIFTRDRQKSRLDEKERFIRSFEAGLDDLAQNLKEKSTEMDKALLASRILKEYKEADALRGKALQAKSELAQKRASHKKNQQALSATTKKINHLLASIEATDRQDFKQKYLINARVEGLHAQRRQAMRTIELIAGVHGVEEVIDYLIATEKPSIEKAFAEAGSELQALRRERDELNRKISADETLRRQLSDSSDLAEIMTRVAVCRQNMDLSRRQWLAAGIARHVLQQVKDQYEQKKQPSIIRNSSRIFRQITADRYQRIQVSLEDARLLVFDENDRARRIDQLSRGTREQLLISIRLGFIEEYEKKAEALPLVLDDVLVNFDPDRAERTAAILHEFSRNRQILFFTCHPGMRGLFRDLPINYLSI